MTVKSFIKTWAGSEIDNWGGITSTSYEEFEKNYKSALSDMAKKIGFELHSFNKGHYEFSAVLKQKSTGNFFYVSVSDVRYFPEEWHESVLYRTMRHDRDWTGGCNNYCRLEQLGDALVQLADRSAA